MLPPPADDCMVSGLNVPTTAVRCVFFPGCTESGLYCRPDPPVFPTGSVLRIATIRPEG